MNFKNFIYSSLLVLLYSTFVSCQGRQPEVYYATIGQNVVLPCKVGGGQYACYSSYTYQNREYEMAYINASRKYTVGQGSSIGINDLKSTDAGFYACSSDCRKMKIDQISYYLQPIDRSGQPVDTSRQFIPIPRFPSNIPSDEVMYVVVTNEADQRNRGAVLSGGEIAGLVVGLVVAFLLTIAIVVLLCCLYRRKKQKGEKILDPAQKSENPSTDFSTMDNDGNRGENRQLSNNKYDQDGNLINTKNIRGPNAFRPNDLGDLNSQDLPNVDINSHQSSRGRNGSNQGSYLGGQPPRSGPNGSQSGSYIGNQNSRQSSYNNQPPNRQYSNQMEIPYENQQPNQIQRPNRRVSENSSNPDNGLIQPPPPKNGPVNNKINFPSRNNSSQQSFPEENVNQKQMPREGGFNPNLPSVRGNQRQQPQQDADNPNLRQIVQDTGFNPNQHMLPNMKPNQRQPPFVPDENNDNPNLRQIVKDSGYNPGLRNNNPVLPQYVSDDENINLHQIIKESGFLADDILSPEQPSSRNNSNYKPQENPQQPGFQQRQPEYDMEPTRQQPKPKLPDFEQEPRQPQTKQRQPSQPNADGGVTVVSARTPSTGNGSVQGFSVLPPTANRSNNSLQQPKYPVGNQQKPLMPHLSYSQRIETTSTPLQLQQPSKSLRTQNTGGMTRPKEGSTDV